MWGNVWGEKYGEPGKGYWKTVFLLPNFLPWQVAMRGYLSHCEANKGRGAQNSSFSAKRPKLGFALIWRVFFWYPQMVDFPLGFPSEPPTKSTPIWLIAA